MSVAEPTPALAPVGRPLAVLAGALASEADATAALEGSGHRVARAPEIADVAAVVGSEPLALVVVDPRHLATAELDEVRTSVDGVRTDVLAVHDVDDDVEALWRSYRAGAVPWPIRRTPAMPAIAPSGSFGGELALDALHEELLGRHVEACRLLASIRDPEMVAEVVEVLVAAGVASLERLRNRSRYPVPTELLVQHLPAHVGTLQGTDFALWWTMVEAVAFRASGLRLPVPEAGVAPRRYAAAFGAFHATSTIVRFTARRQWRQPADLLGDLAEVE